MKRLLLRAAVGCVNQTPLDWVGNRARLARMIEEAKQQGASLLVLPELAITGYGCEDAFFMPALASQALVELAQLAALADGIVVIVGVPVYHEKGLYNCAALLANGVVHGFAAKQFLAGDGIHYEPRWFRPWPRGQRDVVAIDDRQVPIGDILFDVGGVRIGFEICEDAWVADRPGAELALRGADIIANPSASHFAFGKFAVRQRFVIDGSRAFGVAYLYANLLGNEAGRVIYDGGGLIASGGELLAKGPRLTFFPHELTYATLDIDANRREGARRASHRPKHVDDGVVTVPTQWPDVAPSAPTPSKSTWEDSASVREEEFARAVALGLWDYLRKSQSRGYVVSLSGGADSSACAVLVSLAMRWAANALGGSLAEAAPRVVGLAAAQAEGTSEALVRCVLATAYQATRQSGTVTQNAAKTLAAALGGTHWELDVDALVASYVALGEKALGRSLTWADDDITLQNVQARTRAPSIWLLANVRGAVLLTTSNRSECAVGYATMDGDTAGGLAPLAGIDKSYLRKWLRWMESVGPVDLGPLPALNAVNVQAPTAELRPGAQTDEADLMPYDLLEAIEDLAIRDKLAPVDVWTTLRPIYPTYTAEQLGTWVERFFTLWCRSQWKRERFAPGFHLDDRNLDPRSWCRFPILSGGFATELGAMWSTIKAGQ